MTIERNGQRFFFGVLLLKSKEKVDVDEVGMGVITVTDYEVYVTDEWAVLDNLHGEWNFFEMGYSLAEVKTKLFEIMRKRGLVFSTRRLEDVYLQRKQYAVN